VSETDLILLATPAGFEPATFSLEPAPVGDDALEQRADCRHGLLARAARLQERSVACEKAWLQGSLAHVEISEEGRWSILESYRAALGKQLLTPAPDVASVNWKRRELKSYGVKKELVEKAIADDIAFLDAHPTRNSRANKPG
jgi:hypothetical protein